MIKEYSDLNDKQKRIYYKNIIISTVFAFVPFFLALIIIISISFIIISIDIQEPINLVDINNSTDITNSTNNIKQYGDLEFSDHLLVFGFLIVIVVTIYGFIIMGFDMGYYMTKKLGVVTDLDLDKAEKKVKKIKNVLDQYEGESQNFEDVST